MSNLLTTATFERCNRKKDRSVSLSFTTSTEKTPEELMEMDRLLNDSGTLFFKSNGSLTKEEIKELDNVEIEVEGKTKSQRLRNVLYVLCKQIDEKKGDGINDFDNFYSHEMERIIQHYKDKLEQDN